MAPTSVATIANAPNMVQASAMLPATAPNPVAFCSEIPRNPLAQPYKSGISENQPIATPQRKRLRLGSLSAADSDISSLLSLLFRELRSNELRCRRRLIVL